jgi:hypothetical protein
MRSILLRPLMGGLVLAACTAAPPPSSAGDGGQQTMPPPAAQPEFQASHHALVEGVVTSRGGQPLDSVTVVAWRLVGSQGSVAQERVVTDASGRFRLPVRATIGPQPASLPARVVVRGFAYASRYPRGPQGAVALDSATVSVTLGPLSQAPHTAQARITLPLP